MLAAGLDFVLPVYWGKPGHPGRTTGPTSPNYWSTEGIPAMVEALDRNSELGSPATADRHVLRHDHPGQRRPDHGGWQRVLLCQCARLLFAHPAALLGGHRQRPIVWLYDTIWISAFSQSSLDYLSDRFSEDFGGFGCFVVRESQWQTSEDRACIAGHQRRAVRVGRGAVRLQHVAGADDCRRSGRGSRTRSTARVGPERNCFDVDRQNGARYEGQLQQAVAERAAHPGGGDVERVQRGDGCPGDGRDGAAVHRSDAALRRPVQSAGWGRGAVSGSRSCARHEGIGDRFGVFGAAGPVTAASGLVAMLQRSGAYRSRRP